MARRMTSCVCLSASSSSCGLRVKARWSPHEISVRPKSMFQCQQRDTTRERARPVIALLLAREIMDST